MDLSALLLGTAMAALPLIGAGLIATMILLERPGQLSPAPAAPGAQGPARRQLERRQRRRRRARA